MAYKTIELERDGDVAIIRLNDPATLNAVTVTMIEEIDAALDEINGAARSMVLTGAGRAFCSGANLSAGMGDRKSDGPYDSGSVLESHINPLTGEDEMARREAEAMERGLPVDPADPTTWGRSNRNAPCPCGSGRKYKHCHGAL